MGKNKQLITAYIVNGVTYKCNDKGIATIHASRQREPQRKLNGLSEKEVEDRHVNSVRSSGFNEERSLPYIWLCRLFKVTNVKLSTSASIVRFIGSLIEITVPREVYRRRPCIFYWMTEHIVTICNYLKENVVQIVFNEEAITFSPEYLQENISAPPSLSVVPKIHSEFQIDCSTFEPFNQFSTDDTIALEAISSNSIDIFPTIDEFDCFDFTSF